MRRIIRVGLVGLAAITLSVFGVAAPASAATVTVGPGGTYATIQDAVAAAVDGDTITVEAGAYTGAIVVPAGKRLTITGADAATTTIAGSFDLGAVSTISGFTVLPNATEPVAADGSIAVRVRPAAAGSTITGNVLGNATNLITITQAIGAVGAQTTVTGNTLSGFFNNAVYINQSQYVTVSNNTIDNSAGGTANGYGVNLTGSSFVTISANDIVGVDNAIVMHGTPLPVTDVSVSGNQITGTGSSAIVVGNANVTSLQLVGNTISDVGIGAGGASSSAIKFGDTGFDLAPGAPPLDGITIQDNSISNAPRGVTLFSTVALADGDSVTLVDNTFASVVQYALSVDPAIGASVTATGNDFGGAAVLGSVVITVVADGTAAAPVATPIRGNASFAG